MYAFYKMSPCFRVQINATVFHQGQLICNFDPFELCDADPFTYSYSIYYASGLPNVKIMASYSDAVELKIPYIHPRSFLTTNTDEAYNTLGRFRISILNPLLAAEGASSSLTVTTWVYGIDAQVHVPIQDHDPVLNLAQGGDQVEATSLIKDVESTATGVINSGISGFKNIFDEGKNLLRGGQDIYGNIMSGNIGQALRRGQGLVDSLGKIFGFDYPSRTLQPPKTISPIENLAITKGISQSQRLAMDPLSLHALPDELASESLDAMNLKSIVQMPMLLTQFQLLSTSARGTLLKEIPVNPCVSHWNGESLERTYLSYVSNAFTYWCGGLVYDIEIVATKFHSGKLIFAYVPNVLTAPTYSAVSDSLPNIVVDIQQASSVRFIVPYTASTSLKNTFATGPLGSMGTGIVDTCTGVLACYVQNTLAYASNVSPSIEINVYVSAADDFSLFVPQRPVRDRTPGEQVEATSVLLDTNKNESLVAPPVLSFGKGVSQTNPKFGEDYSLFDLIKRFSPLTTFNLGSDNASQQYIPIAVSPTTDEQGTYLSYWSHLYSCWAGSIRYKFVARTNRSSTSGLQVTHYPTAMSIYTITANPDNLTALNFGGLACARTQLCQDNALEVEVPFYSRYNFLLTVMNPLAALIPAIADVARNGLLALWVLDDTNQNLQVDCYVAAGDDFRLIYPRPPPSDNSQTVLNVTGL
jgi:hypothetical protein